MHEDYWKREAEKLARERRLLESMETNSDDGQGKCSSTNNKTANSKSNGS